MGNLAPAYACECNEDCNQGFSGGNTWSKPLKKLPQTNLAVVEQEKVISHESVEPLPLLGFMPEEEERDMPDDVEQFRENDGATDEVRASPEATPLHSEVPSRQEVEVEVAPTDPSPTEQIAVAPTTDGIYIFEVFVTKRSGEGYGLAHVPVDDGSGTLLIVALRDKGPIAEWNEEQRRLGDNDRTVQRGDRIVAVGGITDDVDAMRSMLREDSAVFTLERWPKTIDLKLVKRVPADTYGLSTERVKRGDGKEVLRVTQIWGGLMSEWNQTTCQSRRFHETVAPASEILRLDELEDNPESMQLALMTRDAVELTFGRPDPSAFHK